MIFLSYLMLRKVGTQNSFIKQICHVSLMTEMWKKTPFSTYYNDQIKRDVGKSCSMHGSVHSRANSSLCNGCQFSVVRSDVQMGLSCIPEIMKYVQLSGGSELICGADLSTVTVAGTDSNK
jgi:hypothetical protein